MNKNQQIAKLFFLYIRQELRPGQEKELNEWRGLSPDNEAFFRQETSVDHIRGRSLAHEESKIRILEKLQANFPPDWVEGAPRKRGIVVRMLRVAAMFIGALIVLGSCIVGYEVFLNAASPKNFAMMACVSGQMIILNDFQLGWTAGIRGIKVKKKENGELLYILPNNLKAKGRSDTLWTSNSWRFEMLLPEGSDIWMNLSSKIGYPQNVNHSDTVSYSIHGEAFFKIPGNTNKHYEIRTQSLVIQATGAELDVRSKTDSTSAAVLLISGTASVKSLHQTDDTIPSVNLIPGQQARLVDGKFIVDEHPDIKDITGWKK